MIEASDEVFPNNVTATMKSRFDLIDPDIPVLRRPLRESDPVQCIGIFASMWTPDQDSIEMRGSASPGPQEPTIGRYSITIQSFVKHMDEEIGSATHSVLSKMILAMLYRDEPLRIGLAGLSASLLGVTEQTKRWGIASQRYLNNQLASEWLYLSTVECWLETETH